MAWTTISIGSTLSKTNIQNLSDNLDILKDPHIAQTGFLATYDNTAGTAITLTIPNTYNGGPYIVAGGGTYRCITGTVGDLITISGNGLASKYLYLGSTVLAPFSFCFLGGPTTAYSSFTLTMVVTRNTTTNYVRNLWMIAREI